METLTFKGEELYSAITLNGVKLPYKAGSKLEGQFYYTGRWGARGFTCSEQFAKDFNGGNISQFTIAESEYEADDVLTGTKVMRQSATIMGYVTFDRQIRLERNMTDLDVAKSRREIVSKHARVAAIAELGLNEKDFKLLEALA